GANLGGDGLAGATVELKRALELLVLPPGGVLALARDPDIGSASALPDRGLFGDESSIKACPCARNDLDDFHERPLPRLPVGKISNARPPNPTRERCRAGRRGRASAAAVPPHSDGFVAAWAGVGTSLLRGFAGFRAWFAPSPCRRRPRAHRTVR